MVRSDPGYKRVLTAHTELIALGNQEFHPGLLHEWWGPKHLGSLLLFQAQYQEAG